MYYHQDEGIFAKDMFNHSPSSILCDYVMEGFAGKGCGRTKDGVDNILGKCSGNDGLILTGFVMEEFSHIMDQKLKGDFDVSICLKSGRIGSDCFLEAVRFRLISS